MVLAGCQPPLDGIVMRVLLSPETKRRGSSLDSYGKPPGNRCKSCIRLAARVFPRHATTRWIERAMAMWICGLGFWLAKAKNTENQDKTNGSRLAARTAHTAKADAQAQAHGLHTEPACRAQDLRAADRPAAAQHAVSTLFVDLWINNEC